MTLEEALVEDVIVRNRLKLLRRRMRRDLPFRYVLLVVGMVMSAMNISLVFLVDELWIKMLDAAAGLLLIHSSATLLHSITESRRLLAEHKEFD